MKPKNIIIGLSLTFMVMAFQVSAQKCKYDYEKTDEFTGEKSKGNTMQLNNWWYLGFNKVGEKYNLGLYMRLNGEKNLYLEQGDSIIFKFSDGSFLTLYARERYAPESQVVVALSTAGVINIYRAVYDIPSEKMEILKNNTVTHVKVNISHLVYQKELKEKTGEKFRKNAVCIIE
ncbi:MAG: hypothetical protein LBV74_08520 [Tannerella sp.]|jgi:hypothetical protein|nr:hypothetical protein [Tannerella sp.]